MIWVIAAIVIAVVAFLVYRGWLSFQHMSQLAQGLPIIQKNAFNNVYEDGDGIAPVNNDVLDKQYLQTVQNFGVAYTITLSPDKSHFIHHISGKAPGKPTNFVVENMLLVMSTLIGQFKTANIESENKFAVEQSDLGTQHLEFQLTAQQHAALRSVVEGQQSSTV